MRKKVCVVLCFFMIFMMPMNVFAEGINKTETDVDLYINMFSSIIDAEKQIEREQPAIQAYEQILEGLGIARIRDCSSLRYAIS